MREEGRGQRVEGIYQGCLLHERYERLLMSKNYKSPSEVFQ